MVEFLFISMNGRAVLKGERDLKDDWSPVLLKAFYATKVLHLSV